MSIAKGLVALAALAGVVVAAPVQAKWVASWTAAPHAPFAASGPFPASAEYDNVTVGQILRITEGGTQLRLRLSNRYGAAPLEIGEARIVRIDDANAEIAGTARTITFGGAGSAVIPRGAPFVSDPVAIDLPDFARIKVELYLPKPTGPCTCHRTGLDELTVSPAGNHVGKAYEPVGRGDYRAFLSAIEVESPDTLGTIVTFGDSITDGVGSTSGANRRWPDVLAERLHAAGREWAVANLGISGNRVLSPGMGEAALARFDEDVLSLPNVKYVILFEGVNDIGMRYSPAGTAPPLPGLDQPDIDVAQMIVGYKQFIARAHAKGIKVIGSPIGPYKGSRHWSEAGEAARQAINDWIVNGDAFDGVTRFDIAFADPSDPAAMREGYHMGDFLHGSDAGLKAVGESLDLELFAL